MSLSARDRQALDSREDELAGSDPGLASLLDTFARLEAGEEMPAREDIRAGGLPPAARAPGGTGAGTPRALLRRTRRRLGLRPALSLLWLVITLITLITVTLIINHGGGTGTCTQSWAVACAGQAPAHSRTAADKTAEGWLGG